MLSVSWEVTRLRRLKGAVIISEQAAEEMKLIYGLWHILLVLIASDGQCTFFLIRCLGGGSYTETWWGCEFMQQSTAGCVLYCSWSYVSSSVWSAHAFAANLPNVPTYSKDVLYCGVVSRHWISLR